MFPIKISQTEHRKMLDRRTWAGDTQTIAKIRTNGTGAIEIPTITFGLAFQGAPFFSWGVELASGELVPSDFPIVTAGIASWVTSDPDNNRAEPRHLGANVFAVVWANTDYDLILTLSFEGIAYQNPEYTAGTA